MGYYLHFGVILATILLSTEAFHFPDYPVPHGFSHPRPKTMLLFRKLSPSFGQPHVPTPTTTLAPLIVPDFEEQDFKSFKIPFFLPDSSQERKWRHDFNSESKPDLVTTAPPTPPKAPSDPGQDLFDSEINPFSISNLMDKLLATHRAQDHYPTLGALDQGTPTLEETPRHRFSVRTSTSPPLPKPEETSPPDQHPILIFISLTKSAPKQSQPLPFPDEDQEMPTILQKLFPPMSPNFDPFSLLPLDFSLPSQTFLRPELSPRSRHPVGDNFPSHLLPKSPPFPRRRFPKMSLKPKPRPFLRSREDSREEFIHYF